MSELEIKQSEFATAFRITLADYKKLVSSLSYEELVTCFELLKAKKHRSTFRQDMEKHIRQWLSSGISLKPLTPAQFNASKPKWPVQYNLPR